MSIQLQIKYRAVTLDLMADGYVVMDGFHPDDPRCDVWITGSSIADAESKISTIDAAFEHARKHKTDADPAYLYWAPDEVQDPWRARLLDGTVILDTGLTRRLRESKVKVSLIFEREFGWDGPETSVPLTTFSVTSPTITPVAIDNYTHNYVDIDGDDIEGDLPAKCRIRIENTYVTAGRHWDIWIGQDFTNPGDYAHVQSATAGEVNITPGSEISLNEWTLDTNFLSAAKGREFKMLVKFADEPDTDIWFRFKIQWNVTTLWEGDQGTLDPLRAAIIRDIDTIPLPPWLKGMDTLDGVTLILTGYTVTETVDIEVDYVQITPTDGWRYLVPRGYGLYPGHTLIDSSIDDAGLWVVTDANKRVGHYIGYGEQIRLKPGEDQRLIFLIHSWLAGTAEEDRSSNIQIFYRPRRSTI